MTAPIFQRCSYPCHWQLPPVNFTWYTTPWRILQKSQRGYCNKRKKMKI